jgi:hypothetical protein
MEPLSPDYGKYLLVSGVYVRPTIQRKDIMNFVGELHNMQMDFIEEAVNKSGMKEANEVIKKVMELK